MQHQNLSDRDRAAAVGGIRRFFMALAPETDDPDNAEFLRALLLLGGALFTLTLLTYLCTTTWTWPYPRDKATLVLGRDFLNLWMYGRALFDTDPARFYDVATYNDALASLLGPGYPGQNWPNPPTALVVMAPFGFLAYFPALIAWFAIGYLAFYLAGRREVSLRILAVALVSPAALLCVISGQSSFLTSAALLAIFASLDKRPLVAGVLIGLLTVKPQLGLLFPFALIASGRWRVFLSAGATSLALIAASIALGGEASWHDYIVKALPLQREVLADSAGTAMPFHPTIFMNLRGLLGNRVSEGIQLAFTFAAVATVAVAFRYRRDADPRLLRALFLACTVCASPYMGAYDLLPLTFAAVALLAAGQLDATGRRLVQLVFWAPALQLLFGNLQIPGPGFIAPAFAAYLMLKLFAPMMRRAGQHDGLAAAG
ncbi:MAG TPA: glycosyltransferase family 87 protein [Bradyrhizobium sp.]|uniref:glycosyltransferase family 87 protein n=1 Tax=Bradyrhizobium sp. TaxID=376 RepID=UPI002D1C72BC|nr:glycosyltransferase family 87 protein [Bradyrhizobium sp.]HTB02940.1 glycosyltransferase family 87 protein [Bradyrhizobium sp.]